MPRYGFRCDGCGGEADLVASLTEPKELTCECGTQMRRAFTPVGLLGRSASPPGGPADGAASPQRAGQGSCADEGVLGGCVVRPELREAWAARNRRDGAAVDRALDRLERKGIPSPF